MPLTLGRARGAAGAEVRRVLPRAEGLLRSADGG
jgi:hypothetical protein